MKLPPQAMSPPGPGMPTLIVAVTFLLCASTRVTVPSPWFKVQMEPSPGHADFQRISYDGPTVPSLATLNGIMSAHVQTIPFENLDVLLGRGIDSRQADCSESWYSSGAAATASSRTACCSCSRRSGSRCAAQRARPQPAPARLHAGANPPVPGLEIDGELAGRRRRRRAVAHVALRLDAEASRRLPHEPRRIVREEGRLFHQVRFGDEWTTSRVHGRGDAADRSRARELVHQHAPAVAFQGAAVAARALPDGERLNAAQPGTQCSRSQRRHRDNRDCNPR